MRPHVHERTCVTVVVDGSFVERVGGRERFCAPGTILSKPGLERHDDHMARTGSRQIIVEPDEREAELLAPCQALFNGISHFRDAAAVGLGRRLALEIEQPDEVTPLALAALAFEVLTLATRRFQRAPRPGRPPSWLERAHDELVSRFREAPTLEELARSAGVHPAYLARLFRAYYGCSVGTLVRKLRIQAAATELSGGDRPIAEVAHALGFADQSHFTRLFREHLGLTPGEYRRRHRGA